MTDFWKYQALGNDYLVMEPGKKPLTSEAVKMICDRHTGVGSDGILWGPLEKPLTKGVPAGVPGLRIYNPDGSEAEKSGNGLRIFARHLWERKMVTEKGFSISTLGSLVKAEILDETGDQIAIDMGQVHFGMPGSEEEGLQTPLEVGGEIKKINVANVGNPHCVVFMENPTEEEARRLGPLLENHPMFPQRTNVQLVKVEDTDLIRIQIWERGAGYTLASGSSSCAAAAVSIRLGFCRSPLQVLMPGGVLFITMDENDQIRMEGPVSPVGKGSFHPDFAKKLGLPTKNTV